MITAVHLGLLVFTPMMQDRTDAPFERLKKRTARRLIKSRFSERLDTYTGSTVVWEKILAEKEKKKPSSRSAI
jgi:hypothetical protein